MAKAGSRRKRRSNGRRGGGQSVVQSRGLVLGVVLAAVALAWFFRADLPLPGADPAPARPTAALTKKKPPPPPTPPPAAEPEGAARFEFYDMLPDAEVDVAVQTKGSGGAVPAPVSVPGTYVVQAGAFPDFAEADKVKARLALLGIVSEIQAADANGVRFHRVRIGPIDNLDQLNRLRTRLRQNGIDNLVIPVGE